LRSDLSRVRLAAYRLTGPIDAGYTSDVLTFREWRFGLFVHFGLYSIAARHEWVKSRERLTDEEYRRYFDHFDPDLADPREWASAARSAGMRYAVLTTKHHDGFCLWDSALSDYTVANTPYGKDLVGPFVDACRAEGLGVGFYHSLLDWHHPEFPIDLHHPQRDDADASARERDMSVFADYLHGQVRELLTRYGPIEIMWFDFSYPDRTPGGKGRDAWRSEELLARVRELQPGILVNDRLDLPDQADFVTPEQYQPSAPLTRDGVPVPWEACQTLNGSWGYDRDNLDWKSPELLVRMLIDSVSKDGNLLLNVGPTGRGEFEPRALDTLAEIGRWMRLHSRSIHGCGPSELTPPPDCRFTQRGDRLYLHVFAWPMTHLHLPSDLTGRIRYAQLLHDASEVRLSNTTLHLPIQRPDVTVPVVELFLT
jgi:alpha-L-fucosidase